MALWKSLNPVHFADGTIDYLSLICYHDNDISNNNYFTIGTIKNQGEIFFHTGTGGSASGDHVHIETGKGQQNTPVYHFTDSTTAKRIVPDDVLYVNDTYVTAYTGYDWQIYQGGQPGPTPTDLKKKKFPWVLYARKLRNKRNNLT